jgi:hypothetical protein
VLNNGRFEKEKEDTCNHRENEHDHHIVPLVKFLKYKSRNEIPEDLRAHVEGPEERIVEALVVLNSAVWDIGTRGWLSDSFPEPV